MASHLLTRTEPWIYFDANAITAMWNWSMKTNKEGKTGDPRDQTPFQHAVLSDFSLDEIITNPIDDAYKRHIALLTIYQDFPVLKPLEGLDFSAVQADRTVALNPPDFLPEAITTRLLALTGHPEAVRAHEHDVANKQRRIQQDIEGATGKPFVPTHLRKPLGDVIDEAVALQGWQPAKSAADFFALCKHLVTCEQSRYIARPAGDRKTAARYLNIQIDYYHLSYLPLLDGFVTDDKVLRETAEVLTERFCPKVDVYDVDTYHRHWIRTRLTT